jgi:hypothetical protein
MFASLVSAASCTGVQRVQTPYPEKFDPRQQVEVWEGETAVTLHGVSISDDSVVGIVHWQGLACDSCRKSYALSAIDSLRTGSGEKAAMLATVLPIAFAAAALIAWRVSEGD